MFNFFHTFNPNPVLINLGPITIYWYGLFIVLGVVTALMVTARLGKYYGIEHDSIIDISFWMIIFGLIGARIYHVLLELPYYLNQPAQIFKIWQGGIAIHGAIIGGALAGWLACKKYKINPIKFASIVVPGLALAQAIGRWGNYFNQELFGRPTNLPWGIPIGILKRPAEYARFDYFHPTFFYESIGSLIIFVILMLLHRYNIKNQKKEYLKIILVYLFLYSILRFTLEFIRIDSTPQFGILRWPQIISLIIISAAAVIYAKYRYSPLD